MSKAEGVFPAVIFAVAQGDYPAYFQAHREVNGEAVSDMDTIFLAVAAAELAIGLTQAEDGVEAQSMEKRLPKSGEIQPEAIFEVLSESERANLNRASLIIDLIHRSTMLSMHARDEHHVRTEHG